MPSRKQRVRTSFPFNFGLKDGLDKNQFGQSQLIKAINASFVEEGSIELTRPFGFVKSYSRENIIAIRRSKLRAFAFSPQKIYSIESDYSLNEIGNILNCEIDSFHVFQSYSNVLWPDFVLIGDKAHLVFNQGRQIFYTVFDISKNYVSRRAVGISPENIPSIRSRIISQDDKPNIVYMSQDKKNIYLLKGTREGFEENRLLRSTTGTFNEFSVAVSGSVLTIYYQEEIASVKSDKRIQYSLSTDSIIGTVQDNPNTAYNNIKDDTTVGGVRLNRFNKWMDFTFNEVDYHIFWNDFRGYFITDSLGNQVGKFMGKISPQVNQGGVEFRGVPHIMDLEDSYIIIFPVLKRDLQVQQDASSLTNPIGLSLAKIEIFKKRLALNFAETKNVTALAGGIISQVDSEKLRELGFSEEPALLKQNEILDLKSFDMPAVDETGNVTKTVDISASEIDELGLKVPKTIDPQLTLQDLKKIGSGTFLDPVSFTRNIGTGAMYEVIDVALSATRAFTLENHNGVFKVGVFNRATRAFIRSFDLRSLGVANDALSGIEYISICATNDDLYLTGDYTSTVVTGGAGREFTFRRVGNPPTPAGGGIGYVTRLTRSLITSIYFGDRDFAQGGTATGRWIIFSPFHDRGETRYPDTIVINGRQYSLRSSPRLTVLQRWTQVITNPEDQITADGQTLRLNFRNWNGTLVYPSSEVVRTRAKRYYMFKYSLSNPSAPNEDTSRFPVLLDKEHLISSDLSFLYLLPKEVKIGSNTIVKRNLNGSLTSDTTNFTSALSKKINATAFANLGTKFYLTSADLEDIDIDSFTAERAEDLGDGIPEIPGTSGTTGLVSGGVRTLTMLRVASQHTYYYNKGTIGSIDVADANFFRATIYDDTPEASSFFRGRAIMYYLKSALAGKTLSKMVVNGTDFDIQGTFDQTINGMTTTFIYTSESVASVVNADPTMASFNLKFTDGTQLYGDAEVPSTPAVAGSIGWYRGNVVPSVSSWDATWGQSGSTFYFGEQSITGVSGSSITPANDFWHWGDFRTSGQNANKYRFDIKASQAGYNEITHIEINGREYSVSKLSTPSGTPARERYESVAITNPLDRISATNLTNTYRFKKSDGTYLSVGPPVPQGTPAQLYMIGRTPRALYRLNKDTGVATSIGTLTRDYRSMEIVDGTIYAVEYLTGNLYSINKTTAAETRVGTGTSFGSESLANLGSTLYQFRVNFGTTLNLYSLSPSTGVGTLLGTVTGVTQTLQFNTFTGLAPLGDDLYGVFANSHLYKINPTTRVATYVGQLKDVNNIFLFMRTLTSIGETLYGIDSNERFYTINKDTGVATRVGTTFGVTQTDVQAMATEPAIPAPPVLTRAQNGDFWDDMPDNIFAVLKPKGEADKSIGIAGTNLITNFSRYRLKYNNVDYIMNKNKMVTIGGTAYECIFLTNDALPNLTLREEGTFNNSLLTKSGDSIPVRNNINMTGDANSGVIYGGRQFANPSFIDNFYKYEVTGNDVAVTELTKVGSIRALSQAGMVGDVNSGLLYGGLYPPTPQSSSGLVSNKFYKYVVSGNNATITELTVVGTLPPLEGLKMVGDVNSGIIFGGQTTSEAKQDKFYKYVVSGNNATITELTKTGTIEDLYEAGIAGDKNSGIIFGGTYASGTSDVFYKYVVSGNNVTITTLTKTGSIPHLTGVGMVGNVNEGTIFGGAGVNPTAHKNIFYRYVVSGNNVKVTTLVKTSTIPTLYLPGMVGNVADGLIFSGTQDVSQHVGTDNFYRFGETSGTVRSNLAGSIVLMAESSAEKLFEIASNAITESTILDSENDKPRGIGSFKTSLAVLNDKKAGPPFVPPKVFIYQEESDTIQVGIQRNTGIVIPRTFLKKIQLLKNSESVLSQAVSATAPVSAVITAKRTYDVSYSDALESTPYQLVLEYNEPLPSNSWASPDISHTFTFKDIQYKMLKVTAIRKNDKILLEIEFESLPEGEPDFHIEMDSIGSADKSQFTYTSKLGNTYTFTSVQSDTDVGFINDTDETIDFTIKNGKTPEDTPTGDGVLTTYFAVYKWNDSNGKAYYSKISNLETITTKGGEIGTGDTPVSASMQVHFLNLTNKEDVIVQIYRSVRVFETLQTSIFRKVGEIQNDKTAEKTVYSDSVKEDRLKERFFLFNRDQPNSGNSIIEHQNRIVIAKGAELYFSDTPVFEREEAVSFKIDSVVLFPSDIKAIASLDANVAVITEQGIFSTSISESGVNSSKVQSVENLKIVTNSLVRFQHGIIFQSNYGITLLDRGYKLNYIGEDVKKHLENHRVIDSYVNEERQECVLVLDGGLNLIYNYLYGKWTTQELSIKSEITLPRDNEILRLDDQSRLLSNKDEFLVSGRQFLTSTVETGDIDVTGGCKGFNRLLSLHLLGSFRNFEQIRVWIYKNNQEGTSDPPVLIRNVGISPDLGSSQVLGSDIPVGQEIAEHKGLEIPARLGRLSAIRVKIEIKSKYASKFSGLGIMSLTEAERFFKEKNRYPVK